MASFNAGDWVVVETDPFVNPDPGAPYGLDPHKAYKVISVMNNTLEIDLGTERYTWTGAVGNNGSGFIHKDCVKLSQPADDSDRYKPAFDENDPWKGGLDLLRKSMC